MIKRIIDRALELHDETVSLRRDFHKYPESGFCEFRTVSVIVNYLRDLGFDVKYGKTVINTKSVLGLPENDVLEKGKVRAISEGADQIIVSSLEKGTTAVVATIIGHGKEKGKTVAFRFDIDCNEIAESGSSEHLPTTGGYRSVHDGYTHACGHDGHIAIGLTLARLLSENTDSFSGTVKLIFQPAEEGVRGAKAMVDAGVVDDVDYFFSGHIGISACKTGSIYASAGRFLCATKYNAKFFGKASHAGLKPEEGRNALLAAAQAALSLHSISRHGSGASRINVGVIHGGSGRNIIPDNAEIQFETRGETDEINEYMKSRVNSIVSSSASMYDVDYQLECVGQAASFIPDPEFAHEIAVLADNCGMFNEVYEYGSMNASEDCTAFMNRVVALGGKASYFLYGTRLAAPHHTPMFDFDETTLTDAAAFLTILAINYAK